MRCGLVPRVGRVGSCVSSADPIQAQRRCEGRAAMDTRGAPAAALLCLLLPCLVLAGDAGVLTIADGANISSVWRLQEAGALAGRLTASQRSCCGAAVCGGGCMWCARTVSAQTQQGSVALGGPLLSYMTAVGIAGD